MSAPRTLSLAASIATACVATPLASAAQSSDELNKDVCAISYERAQILLRRRTLVEAGRELDTCLTSCPEVLGRDCQAWRAEQERAVPTVVLEARSAGGKELSEVRVDIDGQHLADRLDGAPRAVDPGTHTFRFARADGRGEVREIEVTLQEGDKGRRISAVLPEQPVAPSRSPEPALARPPRPAGLRATPTLAYVFGAAGIGALGLGGTLVVYGHIERAHLQSTCAPDCATSAVDAIRTEWIVGGIALGASAVMLGATAFVVLSAPTSASPQPGPHWAVWFADRRVVLAGTY